MASYFIPNNFRLSSSAFMWGRLVYTDYDTGCLRKILVQSRHDANREIPPEKAAMGDANEERHAAALDAAGVSYQREVEIFRESGRVSGVTISGHADMFVANNTVHELKSTGSTSAKRDIIANGGFRAENLAQLVAYMGELNAPFGKLIYSYYKDNNPAQFGGERIHDVTIDEYGRICLNGTATQFTAYDVLAHRNAAVEVIKSGDIWDRPYRHDAVFSSPCTYCPLAKTCADYDSGVIEGSDAFVLASKQALESKECVK
jgi:hypothetical protein